MANFTILEFYSLLLQPIIMSSVLYSNDSQSTATLPSRLPARDTWQCLKTRLTVLIGVHATLYSWQSTIFLSLSILSILSSFPLNS